MTYAISDQCIACEKCLPYCPTEAISKNSSGKFSIDPNLCNDCADTYGVAQCMAGCPTANGCTPTISSLIKSFQTTQTTTNYWDNWFTTYNRAISRLKAKQETKHWQQWFDTLFPKIRPAATHLKARLNQVTEYLTRKSNERLHLSRQQRYDQNR